MSSAAMSSQLHAASVYDSRPFNRGQITRYLNYAASLLIVFGVAFAGAFMAMQMNQPENSSGQFALFSQTDDSATCDVEPLTVERVMEIVRNPYPFMLNGPLGDPAQPENPENSLYTGLREGGWWDKSTIGIGMKTEPTGEVFQNASQFANEYLNCLQTGSFGQVLTFYSPIYIQDFVMEFFPVFADEDEVLAFVEEYIDSMPEDDERRYFLWLRSTMHAMDIKEASVNSDPQLALQQTMWGGYNRFSVTFGVEFTNLQDETVYLTSGTGNELIPFPQQSQGNIVVSVAWDRVGERWYVLPHSPVSLH